MHRSKALLIHLVVLGVLAATSCSEEDKPPGDAGTADITQIADQAPDLPPSDVTFVDAKDCAGDWQCAEPDADGRVFCGASGRLPTFGRGWGCHLATVEGTRTWFCTGYSAVGGAPAGPLRCQSMWRCDLVTTLGELPDPPLLPAPGYDYVMRCQRPEEASDRPPGVEHAACVKGSAHDGTRCEVLSAAPVIPSPTDSCLPGTRVWCSGLDWDGWGQVECQADGHWKTKRGASGQTILDCESHPSALVPATGCACYFPYFNATCCEREDCLVPVNSRPIACELDWGEACTPCMPGAQCGDTNSCVVTNATEAFCSEPCDDQGQCAPGFRCETARLSTGDKEVCVPDELSCYFRQ